MSAFMQFGNVCSRAEQICKGDGQKIAFYLQPSEASLFLKLFFSLGYFPKDMQISVFIYHNLTDYYDTGMLFQHS